MGQDTGGPGSSPYMGREVKENRHLTGVAEATWEFGQDQTGAQLGSAAKPMNVRILNFSSDRQELLKLW